VDLTDEEPRRSATKSPDESSEQAAVVGGAKPPVGAIVGGVFGVIGAVVITAIVYVLLWRRRSASYDPQSNADGDGEPCEVEFGGENFEQTTLVTFQDQTTATIAAAEQTAFVADAPETFGGDIVSLMRI
jgi:hypothetical protein